MVKNEVIFLLKKVQNNYSSFIIDENKIKEWYEELKNYDFNDVLRRLDDYLRSEEKGNRSPRVYELTKNLIKIENKADNDNIRIRCSICQNSILLNDFDEHYNRCSSVDFLNKKNLECFNKEIDREKYLHMNEVDFNFKYNKFCEFLLENTNSEKERTNLMNYFLRGGKCI